VARGYLQAIQAGARREYTEPLLDYIPRVSPRWVAPLWLKPYTDIFERALREPVRAVIAAPPQHGKTETTVHGLTRAFLVKPHGRSAYATYNTKRVARVEAKARLIAEREGMPLRFRQDVWTDTATGGALLWASRKGGLTGEPIDTLAIVDDILKDRQEADSASVRSACSDWFDDVLEPRCHPTASIIVMATRWHPDDLSGVLIKRGWEYLNLKALADGPTDAEGFVIDDPLGRRLGEPLCPERKSRAALLEKQKTNAYSFVSLYQGEPRPRGGTVFGDPVYYDELPHRGYRVAYGVDFAYSKRTHADWSVCLELWREDPQPTRGEAQPKPIFYVVGVDRKQVKANDFRLVLHARQSARRGPMRWYAAGPEMGIGDLISEQVRGLDVRPASADKFVRAQPVALAWNEGRIRVPSRRAFAREEVLGAGSVDEDGDDALPEWRDLLLDEVAGFTGVNDSHDDQVDALAAAFDVIDGGPVNLPSLPTTTPGSRWAAMPGRGF